MNGKAIKITVLTVWGLLMPWVSIQESVNWWIVGSFALVSLFLSTTWKGGKYTTALGSRLLLVLIVLLSAFVVYNFHNDGGSFGVGLVPVFALMIAREVLYFSE